MTKGKLLHNRVCVGEWARITATYPRSSLEREFEGYVTEVSAHRLVVSGERLRRVDITSIEVKLGHHDPDAVKTEQFIAGLVEAALWTDLQWPEDHPKGGDDGESGGGESDYGMGDVELPSYAKLRDMAIRFILANETDLNEYAERREYDPSEGTIWSYAGHDTWLSAGGHGTGYWDRGLGELGDRLHESAKAVFGRFESSALPYVTSNNTISFI